MKIVTENYLCTCYDFIEEEHLREALLGNVLLCTLRLITCTLNEGQGTLLFPCGNLKLNDLEQGLKKVHLKPVTVYQTEKRPEFDQGSIHKPRGQFGSLKSGRKGAEKRSENGWKVAEKWLQSGRKEAAEKRMESGRKQMESGRKVAGKWPESGQRAVEKWPKSDRKVPEKCP